MPDMVSLAVGIAAHRRINSVRSEIRAQSLNLRESELSAVSLRQDIEKLYLLVETLWSILKEKTGLADEYLLELVKQLDLADGKLDGCNRANADIRKCSNCGKTILKGQSKCAYCGEEAKDVSLFRHNGR